MSPPREDTGRKVVALAAPRHSSVRARGLLRELALLADVVSFRTFQQQSDRMPDAIVATSVLPLRVLPPVPTVVWVDGEEDIATARTSADVVMVLTSEPELASADVTYVPRRGVDVGRWPPLAPLVRRRWRERLDLPAELVVGVDPPHDPVRPETALAVAAAAVVIGDLTPLALALGTPVVTSEPNARRYHLRPGVDVEVASGPTAAAAQAARIAADPARAAVLSRRGRRAAETWLDLGRPARAVASRLGLTLPAEGTPADRLDLRLDELAVPEHSYLRDRIAVALAPLQEAS